MQPRVQLVVRVEAVIEISINKQNEKRECLLRTKFDHTKYKIT